jgi:spore coat polysaccharide biosynthesis protein SpsF (cytidylyltransferase family)
MSRGGTLAVVQARMTSTRLPGKVLATIHGESLLALMLGRLAGARSLVAIVVATSDRPEDDSIEVAATGLGVRVHRGPLEDVLGRFVGATRGYDGAVVRLTADCPFVDAELVDEIVDRLARCPEVRYVHNVWPRTYPDGLDVEALAPGVIEEVDIAATCMADREHVTTFLRRHPDRWAQVALEHDPVLGDVDWSVDTAEDLAFVRALAAKLGDRRREVGWREILRVVQSEPELLAMPGGRRG